MRRRMVPGVWFSTACNGLSNDIDGLSFYQSLLPLVVFLDSPKKVDTSALSRYTANLNFRRHGQVVRQRTANPLSPVRFRVAPPKGPVSQSVLFLCVMGNKLAIFLYSGQPHRRHDALALAMTALVNGNVVTLALFGDGLAGWFRGWTGEIQQPTEFPWSQTLSEGMQRLGVCDLASYVGECRSVADGRLSILACGGTVELLGLDTTDVLSHEGIDDVVGLPTIWRRIQDARIVSI
jgi:peroxiredoxin family protein